MLYRSNVEAKSNNRRSKLEARITTLMRLQLHMLLMPMITKSKWKTKNNMAGDGEKESYIKKCRRVQCVIMKILWRTVANKCTSSCEHKMWVISETYKTCLLYYDKYNSKFQQKLIRKILMRFRKVERNGRKRRNRMLSVNS